MTTQLTPAMITRELVRLMVKQFPTAARHSEPVFRRHMMFQEETQNLRQNLDDFSDKIMKRWLDEIKNSLGGHKLCLLEDPPEHFAGYPKTWVHEATFEGFTLRSFQEASYGNEELILFHFVFLSIE